MKIGSTGGWRSISGQQEPEKWMQKTDSKPMEKKPHGGKLPTENYLDGNFKSVTKAAAIKAEADYVK